ncbi:MAG TPA: aspartate/glutamate racemase family protein, partial [Thermoanaerobaculia bacterium]|nr:aspartate/glutamate racemase family protein [Thermoanaerobaculia bacterium]
EEAARRGFRRIGLTGTKYLVESDVYPADYVRPDGAEREEINRIIMDDLVRGVFAPESVSYLQRVIARLRDDGCDAVVLGCTELPLVLDDANSALPVLDSTRLLARAALAVRS